MALSTTRSMLALKIFSPKITSVFSLILCCFSSCALRASSRLNSFLAVSTRLFFSIGILSMIEPMVSDTSFGKLNTPLILSLNNRLVMKRACTISVAAMAFGNVSTFSASSSTILPSTSSETTGKKLSSSLMFCLRSDSVISPLTVFWFRPLANLS